ncbi:hypothetical protein LX36DRAFT_35823 [Colletotrichum falcatum]|nr:hypothetical protein LX36DRAFT_35823 [Colletotrichum falcatum]
MFPTITTCLVRGCANEDRMASARWRTRSVLRQRYITDGILILCSTRHLANSLPILGERSQSGDDSTPMDPQDGRRREADMQKRLPYSLAGGRSNRRRLPESICADEGHERLIMKMIDQDQLSSSRLHHQVKAAVAGMSPNRESLTLCFR